MSKEVMKEEEKADPIQEEIDRMNDEDYAKALKDMFRAAPRKIKRKIVTQKNSFSGLFKKNMKL